MDPRSDVPPDLPDRVDRALAALWQNESSVFDELLEELSDPGTAIGRKLKEAIAHQEFQVRQDPADVVVPGYRVIRELGRGGMGVVYEAEQTRTHRLVALKIIREAHALDEYHRRLFEREVRALGRLKHPNIASIYDAGATIAGHPFFAMELVTGITLTEYGLADEGGAIALRERLRLFQRVCLAVSYAHQRGVIHRDLKPSNVLVVGEDGSGSSSGFSSGPTADIKVLDFGLARMTDDDAAPVSRTIDTGRLKGTLAYASPEQARGDSDRVDVRSDVYSLGVILYQLITGRLPYAVRSLPLPRAIQVICDSAPDPLGSVSAPAGRSRPEPVDADLKTIVSKALEKEPERRYQSAAALAEDLDRYLADQPILARAPGIAYQLRKFLARHKAASAMGGMILLLLVAFAVFAGVQASRMARARDVAVRAELLAEERLVEAEAARDEARTSARMTQAVNAFLQGMIASADPTREGREVRIIDVLDQAVAGLDKSFASDPQIEGALRLTLGKTYRTLGIYDRAERQIGRAIELLGAPGESAPLAIQARNEQGVLLQDMGRPAEAEAIFREVLAVQVEFMPRHDPANLAALNNLALVLQEQGRHADAEPLFREVCDARREVLGPEHEDTLESMNNLAGVLMQARRWSEAEPLCRETLDVQRRVLGPEHPDTLVSMNDLALTMMRQGRPAEAEPLFRQALAGLQKTSGEDHLDALITATNLVTVLRDLGRLDEAAELGGWLVEAASRSLPPESWYTAVFRGTYGRVLLDLGRYAEAETQLLEARRQLQASLGEDHFRTRDAAGLLVKLYESWGRPAEAEKWRGTAVAEEGG